MDHGGDIQAQIIPLLPRLLLATVFDPRSKNLSLNAHVPVCVHVHMCVSVKGQCAESVLFFLYLCSED